MTRAQAVEHILDLSSIVSGEFATSGAERERDAAVTLEALAALGVTAEEAAS